MKNIGETSYQCAEGHENGVYLLMDETGNTYSGSNMDFCAVCSQPTTGELRTRLTIEILDQAVNLELITAEHHRQRVARLRDQGVPDWFDRMAQAAETGTIANRIE